MPSNSVWVYVSKKMNIDKLKDMKTLKRFKLLVGALAGVVMMAACNTNNDPGVRIVGAQIQFVNAYPYADAMGFAVDGRRINEQGINYGAYISYNRFASFIPGTRRFTSGLSGTAETLIDTTITIRDSAYYTFMVNAASDTANMLVAEDKQPEDFDSGKSYVRFFNLAGAVPALNVNLLGSGEPIGAFANRAHDNQASVTAHQDFVPVDPGVYTVQFTDAEGAELTRRDRTEEMRAGYYYTIISRGIYEDPETPLLSGVVRHEYR